MTPRAGDQVDTQWAPFPMCGNLGSFREESWRSDGDSNVFFPLGNRVPTCLGDSTHFPCPPFPGTAWGPVPHLRKQYRHSQNRVPRDPEEHLLS